MKLGIFCVFAAIASAQPGSVGGPSAGYVFDPKVNAVRQIRGIAGAATMGDPMDLGMTIASAEISPRGDLAIVTGADNSIHLFRLANGAATELSSMNLGVTPATAVFSPTGAAAALYRADSVQVLRGLPETPSVAFTASVRAPSFAMMTSAARPRIIVSGAIAVSDDATLVLHARDNAVDLLSASGTRKLTDARAGALVAFAPGTHDAAVLSGGTLTLFQDVTGAGTHQTIPNAGAGASLAFSADTAKLLIAGPRAVTVLDRATGNRTQAQCDCHIGSLAPIGPLFRLNTPGEGPLWLLDPTAAEPKVLFVPARPGA